MTLTVADHGLKNGSRIMVEDGFVTFTCDQDSDQTKHSYPRASDPYSDEWMTVKNVTKDTFDVQVLFNIPSSNTTTHAFVSARPQSITVATLMKGNDSIKLPENALTFTCSKDGNSTEHAYPRVSDPAYNDSLRIVDDGVTRWTPTSAAYTPSTGVMVITVPSHGYSNNDYIQIVEGSLVMRCALDGNQTDHAYPRNTDPYYGKWLKISNVATDTFQVNVGISSDTTTHSFVSAATNGIRKQSGVITVNVGKSPAIGYDVSAASFVPATGLLTVTIGEHDLTTNHKVRIANNSLTFKSFLTASSINLIACL